VIATARRPQRPSSSWRNNWPIPRSLLYLATYPLLGRLERDGLVATHRAASDGGPPRKYYRASPSGRRALAEGVRAWHEVRGEVDSVLATIELEVP
jgi:hypothetical protein